MKIRTDFVSNSSSSSFIVRKDIDIAIDQLFRGEVYDWDKYCDQYLAREFLDCFESAMSSWYAGSHVWRGKNEWNIDDHMTFMPDDKFVSTYVTNGYFDDFVLPESLREEGAMMASIVMEHRRVDSEKNPHSLSSEESKKWDADRWERLMKISEEFDSVKVKALEKLKKLLGKTCSTWHFYQSELGDDNGAEQEGNEKISDYAWYRTFNNH